MGTEKLLKCPFGNDNCFANKNGFCHALQDTNFNGRPCPFYKTKEQYKSELEKYSKIK